MTRRSAVVFHFRLPFVQRSQAKQNTTVKAFFFLSLSPAMSALQPSVICYILTGSLSVAKGKEEEE